MWPFAGTSARSMQIAAFIPDELRRQSSPPSSIRIFSSHVFVVGLPYRPYSYDWYLFSWYAMSSSVSLNQYVEFRQTGVASVSDIFARPRRSAKCTERVDSSQESLSAVSSNAARIVVFVVVAAPARWRRTTTARADESARRVDDGVIDRRALPMRAGADREHAIVARRARRRGDEPYLTNPGKVSDGPRVSDG
eukprot:30861-Pelagococcus_subviridis.AAC.5